MLFYIVSSVLPDTTKTGGEIVLYRHFVERKSFNFQVIDVPIQKNIFFKKLETSRFRSYFLALLPFFETYDLSFLEGLAKPTFVLTVAHDRACFAAQKAANYWQVPLVTIFHDWYPASSGAHPKLLYLLNREFKQLYHQSALALCVSQQMMVALGKHCNAIVLPPISSATAFHTFKQVVTKTQQPKLLYSGFCGGAYHNMLQQFIDAAQNIQMVVSGPHSLELQTQSPHIHLAGFLEQDSFATIFEDADILLVILNFNAQNRMHFSTHFPSKLVEYVGKGKMIAIWGPSYATAIQWAKETRAAFYYEQPDAEGLLKTLLNSYSDTAQRNSYIENAAKVYETEFSPDVVDGLLKKKLNELVC